MPIQTTPSRLGQNNLAGDVDANFMKIFTGEILTVFDEANVMLPLVRTRTITSGKEATFAVTGVASAAYHTPGESVLTTGASTGFLGASASTFATGTATDTGAAKYLNRIRHSERKISIDDVLLSSAFVARFDELKNHYDVRSTYAKEMGRSLADAADKNLIRTVIAAARTTTDRFGGTDAMFLGAQVDVSSDATVTGDELIAGIFGLAQRMDEKNVPRDGRYCILTPAQYYKIAGADTQKAINRDWGGNGNFAKGSVVEIAGITIMKSVHIPTTDESSASNIHNAAGVKNDVFGGNGVGYGGASFANTLGIGFQTEGVGTVKLMDLSVESEYIMERLGTLMLAKYAMGHGVLREECCFEIVV
jgi:hypothetical protein